MSISLITLRQVFFKTFIFGPFILLAGCHNGAEAPRASARQLEVEAYIVKARPLQNTISTTGSVMANEEVQLKSEIAGKVESINFKEGEPVRKGQLLVEVDNQQYYARLRRVKIQLDQAETNLSRQKELLEIEGISKEAYEQAELKVAELKAQKSELQAQLDNTVIRAPFDGTIGLRMISPGSFVNPGDNIAYLVQDNPVKVEFSIPEAYAGQAKENSLVHFTITGISDTQQAQIYAIEPRIDPGSRTIRIRAKAQNEDRKLVPGAFAEVQVNLGTNPDAILIPSNAVITENDGKSIFVIQNGKAVKKPITTGIRTVDKIEVIEGLSVNDTVIVTGLLGLKEGVDIGVSRLLNAKDEAQ